MNRTEEWHDDSVVVVARDTTECNLCDCAADTDPCPPYDLFRDMWSRQESFMKLIVEKRGFPNFPVDVLSKGGQKLIKDISHECADELCEARQHLKNGKQHRATEVKDFDRDGYIEELVDSYKYFLEILILSGVTIEEFYAAYVEKDLKNVDRIMNGY